MKMGWYNAGETAGTMLVRNDRLMLSIAIPRNMALFLLKSNIFSKVFNVIRDIAFLTFLPLY